MARERRLDRRVRPARRRGARDGLVPDLQAVGLRRTQGHEEARPLSTRRSRRRRTIPGINRATAATYPPGSTFKPVTALAAMQEHILHPVRDAALLGDYSQRRRQGPDVQELGPVREPVDRAEDRARRVLRHLLLPSGKSLLRPAAGSRAPAPEVGVAFRVRRDDRASTSGGGAGSRADAGVAARARSAKPYTRSTAPGSRDTRSSSRSGRATSLVTPLQMTRFYAMVANGGKLVTPHIAEDVEQPTGDPKPAHPAPLSARSRRAERRRPGGAAASSSEGLFEATHSTIGTSSGSSASSRSRSRARRERPRSSSPPRVLPTPPENQSWWCGYGPDDAPTIVVCAVIENGGHGGDAAAPAALKVFEEYFGKSRSCSRRLRLMAFEAVDTRARGLRPRRAARPSGSSGSSAGSTGCCSAAVGAIVAYGLWAIDGITRHDSRREPRRAAGACTSRPARR